MNRFLLTLLFAAASVAASAQAPSKPSASTSSAAKSSSAASTASTTKSSTTASSAAPWIKLPPGVPRVAHGPVKTIPISVHYEEIKVGTGAVGASGKLWRLKYTGWRAADGVKFDSWDEDTRPVRGKDGKLKLGPDGKPEMGDPQPIGVPQGIGAVIPGFDYGLVGIRIGGKRRIFIPWQLAYGLRAIPNHPGHAGIPAKSDLIFDVELVDVTDLPARPAMMPMRPKPGIPPHSGMSAHPNATPAVPGTQAAPAANAPTQPSTPAQSSTSAPAIAPAQP